MVQRSARFALLCRIFSYPDAALRSELPTLALQAAWPLPEGLVTASLLELEAQHTGLFINRLGGAAAPPYGSVYLDEGSQMMGKSCREVLGAYEACGLAMDGSPEPADYLPTELEFMYFLSRKEEEITAETAEELGALRDLQQEFWSRMMAPWLPRFCERLEAEADLPPLFLWATRRLSELCEDENRRYGISEC